MKYYNLQAIRKQGAAYNIIIGKRGNGKTYAVLQEIADNYLKDFKQGAYIRRYAVDVKGRNLSTLIDKILPYISSKSEYTTYKLLSGDAYLGKRDGDQTIYEQTPFLRTFSISDAEHTKGGEYRDVTTILFDEFTTHSRYLKGEFVGFMDLISTIVRDREDVSIYLCGNTVDRYCPYFDEFGLHRVLAQKQGTIDVYTLSNGHLLACEYCDDNTKDSKKGSKYFAFDNAYTNTVVKGVWEVCEYPHFTGELSDEGPVFVFFVSYKAHLLQGNVYTLDTGCIVYMHPKTTPIRSFDLLFTDEIRPERNAINDFTKPIYKAHKKLFSLYIQNKFYYSSNEVGDLFKKFVERGK